MYRRVQQRGSPDFSDMADMKVNRVFDEIDEEENPIDIPGFSPPPNVATKSTSDVVTVPGAYTDTEGVTFYRPKGDPFQYRYDAKTGEFSAYSPDGTLVVTGVKEGDAAYEEFLKHAKGGQTSYHGGSAQEEVSPGALITDADYAQAFEEMNAPTAGLFQGPVDPRTPADTQRLFTEHERETAELLAALPEGADPTEVRMRQGERLQEKLRQLDGQEAAREESLPLPAEEALPVEESPPASPPPKEIRDNAASTAINREERLAEFRRTATDEQKQDLGRAQTAYALGMRAGAIREVRAAMQKAADAEGSGYQVTDADAIYLLENY
tara:strand:- start:634 stop:1608 length:975 start_codon:yes stop_codon:yes gene_type:complete